MNMNRVISKLRYPLLAVAVGGVLSGATVMSLPTTEYSLVQQPLDSGRTEAPLMMMVMSRDHSLFTKAYSDYSDLNGDGHLDTTYDDTFSYSGYFDSELCYGYSSGRFEAVAKATGANLHECSGQWSGNFLNWISMSRMDVLRHVLYGGKRSDDTATSTVLERAYVPNDLHAWVKHYKGNDINRFAPLSGAHSFCNLTPINQSHPIIRVASGIYPEWASGASVQCILAGEFGSPGHTANVGRPTGSTDLVARVDVCRAGVSEDLRESYCKAYTSPGGVVSYKPTGLIQEYGESSRLRFGLISGSHGAPRSGGVLRRNIGKVAGNGAIGGCAAGDEINLHTGQFCNQTAGAEGIINTIERFTLTGWRYATNEGQWRDCSIWGIRARRGSAGQQLRNPGSGSQHCSGWGNPMSEMYAEALRYIAGETAATAAFNGGTDLPGMPVGLNWQDPYRGKDSGGSDYCSNCSILMLSSSEPQFDSDEIPTVPRGIGDGRGATDAVGAHEGISGSYLVGGVGLPIPNTTDEEICSAKNVTGLGTVRGVCPDVPSLEGSYAMTGMAHKAKTTDMRPGLPGKPTGHMNTVTTYAVAMADSLPKFDLPLPGGNQIRLTPICQSNSNGAAGLNDGGWSTCSLGSVDVGQVVSNRPGNAIFGRNLKYDGGQAVAGSYKIVWEDSTFGSDNDNDAINMITYCVGAACSDKVNPRNTTTAHDICYQSSSPVCAGAGRPAVAANEVLVRIETLSSFAGYAMMTGLVVSGSNDDGVKKLLLRPGGRNGSYLSPGASNFTGWTGPTVIRLRRGSALAGQLRSPLWYAAKYGGFSDVNGNGMPDAGEWDSKVSGEPDNYFFARDPSKLKDALREIFERAAGVSGPSGFGGSGVRVNNDSFTISSAYNVPDQSNDWTGTLTARAVNPDGSAGSVLWEAGSLIPAPASRKLFVTTRHTVHAADGAVASAAVAQPFEAANLGTTDAARRAALGVPSPVPSWMPGVNDLVSYLRGQERPGLRLRSSRLGSIVNSAPEMVTPKDDFGYGNWYGAGWRATLSSSYRTYRSNKASRIPMVYVGANDGILHGFNASTGGGGGTEVFGFIPAGSRSHMYELADPQYAHRYFVDGKLTSADVYAATATGGAQWRTVLVGSTGAGGARSNGLGGSVFALDVSNPGSFGANDVLWELTGETDNDLGFVMAKASVVPIKSPSGAPMWVALFGNGPNSVNSEPVLYVVDIGTGRILRKLSPGNGYSGRNGLMSVAPVTVGNNDGLVDTVYAGDMRGNLWRFDLTNPNPAMWNVAFGGQPLFTAQANFTHAGISGIYAQPITGEIEVARGAGNGLMVYFGTGSYFIEGDNQTTDSRYPQSFYAIWDNMSPTRVSSRSELVAQTISHTSVASGYTTRKITYTPVNYPPARGWYIDLAVSVGIHANWRGERAIGTPRIQNGMVMFTTYEPTSSVCSGKGKNQLYAIDALTGAGSMSGVSLTWGGDPLCVDGCGAITLDKDGATSSPARDIAIFLPPSQRPADFVPGNLHDASYNPAEDCVLAARTQGADTLYMSRQCGRQSWRQLR